METDFILFKRKKNFATFVINKARKDFYADFVDSNSCDQGKLFRRTSKLLAPRDILCFPDYQDNWTFVNDIASFFYRKISYICEELDTCKVTLGDIEKVPDNPVVDESQHFSQFRQLSLEDVTSLIQKSAKKTCVLDPMPTSMAVACQDELLPIIRTMLNSSLALGYFPSKWKEALIDPHLKAW